MVRDDAERPHRDWPDTRAGSGPAAGAELELSDLVEAKEAVGDFPVLANTGVRDTNVTSMLAVADGAIVGTSLKEEGSTWTRVDPERAGTLLVDAIAGADDGELFLERSESEAFVFDDGRLDEHQVEAFAEAGKFDEANAAIAALANVPVSVAENMMVETRTEGVMILAKVSGMSWSTVKAIINMRDDLSGLDRSDLDACKSTYERLRPSTAQQVLRFHRMQQTAAPAA